MIVTVMVQLRINCSISLHKYYMTTKNPARVHSPKISQRVAIFSYFQGVVTLGARGANHLQHPPP